MFRVGDHDELLASARWRAGEGTDDYRQWRPLVERSMAWLVANGHRRVRYRGVERNRLGLSLRAAVINLRRLLNLGLDRSDGWQLAT
jgi:IS5 family transposase